MLLKKIAHSYNNQLQKMKMKTGFVAALSLVLVGLGCNQVDFKTTKSGLAYKLFPGNGKDTAGVGTILKLHFRQVYKDSELVSSYGGLPVYVPVADVGPIYQLPELLRGRKKGDSVWVVQAVDTLLRKNPQGMPPAFKPGTSINTGFIVLDVFKSQEEAQKDELKEREAFEKSQTKVFDDYVAKNKINGKKTASGVIVQITQAGNGTPAAVGKTMSVMYRGTTLAGKEFDTNMDASKGHTEPLQVALGQGGMIKGFEEGLMELKTGDKAKLYMPQATAYGGNPPPGAIIKPYESLIFEITVLKVEDTPVVTPDSTRAQPSIKN